MARKLPTFSVENAPVQTTQFDGVANAWLDAFQQGAQAWTSTATNLMETFAAAGQAQAELVGEVMSFWTKNTPINGLGAFLRDELFLAESAGERLSDAARSTLRDVNQTGATGATPTLPE